jgi:epoxyqueuosine reductase QueG
VTTIKAPYPDEKSIHKWNQEEFMQQFYRRATDGDSALTQKCKDIALKHGADMVGVGDGRSSDWDLVHKGFRPIDYMPEVSRIFTGLVARYDFLMDETEMHIRVLAEEFQTKPAAMNSIMAVARFLEQEGYQSILCRAVGNDFQSWRLQSPQQAKIFKHFWWAPLSTKHLAVTSGLGRMGMNNLLLTEDFGPRVHTFAFLTDAPLIPNPIWPEEICLEKKGEPCGKCYKTCPSGALHGDGSFEAQRCFSYGNEVYGVPLTYVFWKPCPSPCVTACPIGNEDPRRPKTPHPYYQFPD